MGTPDFAVPSLLRLIEEGYNIIAVVTQPDRPKGRKRILTPSPVKELALKYELPVLQPEKIRKKEAYEDILALEPDLIITAAFGQILPKKLLDAPRLGCINVHASLLPKYRGGAPIHYAVMNGEKETGITIMYMVEALDAGDIISQARIRINEDDTTGTIFDRLAPLGADLLIQTLPELIAGSIVAIPQDEALVTFAPTIKRNDEWIDFNRSSVALYNHIRGLNPSPVASAILESHVIKVWHAFWRSLNHNAVPGTILKVDSAGIEVATGEGILILTKIQLAGKRPMDISEFLRGNSWIKEGMMFDHVLT